MKTEHQLWSARGLAVAEDVRREVARRALKSVRLQVERAGGDWDDHSAQVRAAVRDFLGGASAYHVILYAASAEAVPHRYTGPGDEAFPGAVRRAVRRIGRLLPALAAVAGLEALASTLGEDSPLVRRLRANG
ncbi:MAG: hypothetical protein DYG93_01885 [Leptolyngbya sp. PLA2]|nr:hypothetical protein [Leptolyngbya sp. PL-A2]MCQ3941036.1 hypothetical protein [cyanobacterium CYA1]MDL1905629.1 hypothetical protein [Synechococcales cyanobacterium CNB]